MDPNEASNSCNAERREDLDHAIISDDFDYVLDKFAATSLKVSELDELGSRYGLPFARILSSRANHPQKQHAAVSSKHLFCDNSRTAKSCAYRLHSMPVTPKGVLPCAAQLLDRLLMGRTMGVYYCETDEYNVRHAQYGPWCHHVVGLPCLNSGRSPMLLSPSLSKRLCRLKVLSKASQSERVRLIHAIDAVSQTRWLLSSRR